MENPSPNLKPFRVLTLDGGGIRGLYTASVLHTLMRRYRADSTKPDAEIGAWFDLIVGTSTGGILAAALANGVPTKTIIQFYSEAGKDIFPDPVPESLWKWGWRNRNKPSGNASTLLKCLTDIFQDQTVLSMYERRKIGLCIPAVNVGTNKAWVFKTPHLPGKHRDDNYKLVDVCMATSAAPIFLPLHSIVNPDSGVGADVFADGGLWANNPVLVGLIDALEIAGDRPIEIISVGTCPPPSGQVVSKGDLQRGLIGWKAGIKIVETSLDAQASGYQFIAGFLIKKFNQLGRKCTLIRLPQTPPSSDQIKHLGLDSANDLSIDVLSQLAKSDGEHAHGWSINKDSSEKSIIADIFSGL